MLSAPLHFLAVIKALCLLQITGWRMVSLLSWSWEEPAQGHVLTCFGTWGSCHKVLQPLQTGSLSYWGWMHLLCFGETASVRRKLLFYWSIERCWFCHGLAQRCLAWWECLPIRSETHLPTVTWSPPLCSSQPRACATYWYPVKWLLIIFICYHLSVPLPHKTDLHESCISLWHKTVFSKYFLIE